jgi:uncharacterized protein (DUF2164 family)
MITKRALNTFSKQEKQILISLLDGYMEPSERETMIKQIKRNLQILDSFKIILERLQSFMMKPLRMMTENL